MIVPLSPHETLVSGIPHRLIRLSDGQFWGIAAPEDRLEPKFIPKLDILGRRRVEVLATRRRGYPAWIERRIEDVRSACETGTPEAQRAALIALSVALLQRVHRLEVSEAEALVSVPVHDLPRLAAGVLAVSLGVDDHDSAL